MQQGDVQFVQRAEKNIEYLKGTEKTQAQKILTLFKVLISQEQSMNAIDFSHAIRQVNLSYYQILTMNKDLSLIQVSSGNKNSYLVFNVSKKMYKFSLQGAGEAPGSSYTQNFDGGVFEYHCRVLSYGVKKYKYRVKSIEEIPGF